MSIQFLVYKYSSHTYSQLIALIPTFAPFEAWVCGHSLAGIAVLNFVDGMEVCLLLVLYIIR